MREPRAELHAAPRRRSVRWLAVASVAVTIGAVLTVVIGLLRPLGTIDVPVATPHTGTPELPPGWTAPVPVLPGLSEAQAKDIAKKCDTQHKDAQLYNVFTDSYGTVAFVFGTTWATLCEQHPDGTYSDEGGGARSPRGVLTWLISPVTIDIGEGGQVHKSGPWAETFAGRVAPSVTRVTIREFGRSIDVPVVNGTYLGRIVFMEQATVAADLEVTGYDAQGDVVGKATMTPGKRCTVTPEGVVLQDLPEGMDIPTHCSPAVRWR